MDLTPLKNELANDPLSLGYAGKTAQEKADLLNVKNRTKLGPVTQGALLKWCAAHNVIDSLEDDENSSNSSKQSLCKASLELLRSPQAEPLDLGDSDVMSMLDNLAALNVITDTVRDDLVTRATISISRAEELGYWSGIGIGYIHNAEALP